MPKKTNAQKLAEKQAKAARKRAEKARKEAEKAAEKQRKAESNARKAEAKAARKGKVPPGFRGVVKDPRSGSASGYRWKKKPGPKPKK